MGYFLFIGINLSLNSLLEACSEMAKFTCNFSLASFLIPSVMPQVEMEMCLAPKLNPSLSLKIFIVSKTLS